MGRSADSFRPTTPRRFPTPLTIGVISDTHINRGGQRRLPPEVPDLFARFGVDLILHAGDVNTLPVLAELGRVAPVIAVTGNNDDRELREICREQELLEVGKYRLALLHGHGGASAYAEAKRLFAGKVDLVVYGHSHIPRIDEEAGTVLFNPGSATDRRWQEHFGVGLLFCTAERITPELVLYHDPRHLKNVRPD